MLTVLGLLVFFAEPGSGIGHSDTGIRSFFTKEAEAAETQKSVEWNLRLVNAWHKLPENYSIEFTALSNGERVDKRIYPALQAMFDDARAEGIYPFVREGYRTTEEQQQILDEKTQAYVDQGLIRTVAKKKAREMVALPGTSEHQLGIAVDINADKERCSNDEVYAWLAENAYKYGFILRYPQGKTEITGIEYEPWHYRYVGEEAAKEIHEQGICLEEYLGETEH
ncbi:MAG: M15 family metallopeptidase [Lachnospiraceae bacterium]|nr:M15 family metallopeptidase [Lachnospiraceae bacterium]